MKAYRDKSILWHQIWKDCGRPREGYVADIRRCTRSDYHGAVKNLNTRMLKGVILTPFDVHFAVILLLSSVSVVPFKNLLILLF